MNLRADITLDLRHSHTRYLHIRYILSGLQQNHVNLAFPVWSPGSYLVREYQSQVESLRASDARGNPVKFTKMSKQVWQFQTRSSKLILDYRVYTCELNVRSSYADDLLAFINPTSAFFFPEKKLETPVSLKVILPPRWKIACSSVPKGGKFYFSDFDRFYDVPLLASPNLEQQSFKVGKTHYEIAAYGTKHVSLSTITSDAKKIVQRQIRLFGENPDRRYVFQILFSKGKYGGLEHAASSTNLYDGTLLDDPKSYKIFLALLSHEHFHLWNVKRIRPRALGPFNYLEEVYTRDLWIAEGITSHYDDYFVLRAGLMKRDEYLQIVADNITKMEAQPGYDVNSLSESSFDAWIRFYRQNENSTNVIASYYLKGGLVALLLHLMILKNTNGKFSLDDVMRSLYRLYRKRPHLGVTRAEFFTAVSEIDPKMDTSAFEKQFIDGVKPLPWKSLFAKFGIVLQTERVTQRGYLGVHLSTHNGRVIVNKIVEDSPAFHSVLLPEDEILAVEGERIETEKQIDPYLKRKKISLIYSRLGRVRSTVVHLGQSRELRYKLSVAKKISSQQRLLLKRWIGDER